MLPNWLLLIVIDTTDDRQSERWTELAVMMTLYVPPTYFGAGFVTDPHTLSFVAILYITIHDASDSLTILSPLGSSSTS